MVDGDEGAGKTRFALMICKYFDPLFSEKFVAYSFADVMRILDDLGPPETSSCRAVLLDEGAETLFNLDYNKRDTKDMQRVFFRIRKNKLFFVICIPSALDLVKSFRRRRVKTIFHTFLKSDEKGILRQGYFEAYSYDKVKRLITEGNYPQSSFTGTFAANEVPEDLWNKVQDINLRFLSNKHHQKVIMLEAKYAFDLRLITAIKECLKGRENAWITVTDLRESVWKQYGFRPDWCTERLIGSRTHKKGFQRSVDRGVTGYVVDKKTVDAYEEDIKLQIKEAEEGN